MRRALRLIYGTDSDIPAEAVYLLPATGGQHSTQLCNQAMRSLLLLSSKDTGSGADSGVKFSASRYVPMTCFCSIIHLLDAESVRSLQFTSKSFLVAIASHRPSEWPTNMPLYSIGTSHLSNKIQHLSESSVLTRNTTPPPAPAPTNDDFQNVSCDDPGDNLFFHDWEKIWFLFAAAIIYLLFVLILTHNHIYYSPVYAVGLIGVLGVWYACVSRKQGGWCSINSAHDTARAGYDSI